MILIALYLGFGLAEPAFFSAANALNIIKQSSYLIVLAAAQMFVLLTRGFDLSLGVVVSMVSVASALIMAGIAPNGEGTTTITAPETLEEESFMHTAPASVRNTLLRKVQPDQ